MSFILLLAVFLLVILISAMFSYKRHKKIAVGLLSIPILLIFLVIGLWLYEEKYHFIKSTDLSEEFLGDIHLNDSINKYKKVTSMIEFSTGDNVYYPIFLQSSSLVIGANSDDEIEFIESSLSNHETSKKIKVNDNEKMIITKYGANYYKGRDMGMGDYIVYVDRASKRYLRFWLESGEVRAIELKKI